MVELSAPVMAESSMPHVLQISNTLLQCLVIFLLVVLQLTSVFLNCKNFAMESLFSSFPWRERQACLAPTEQQSSEKDPKRVAY